MAIPIHHQPPHTRYYSPFFDNPVGAIAFRVLEATARFFVDGLSSLGFSSLRERVIDLLPEKIAMSLDPRRELLCAILRLPSSERMETLKSALLFTSSEINQIAREALLQTLSIYPTSTSMLRGCILSNIHQGLMTMEDVTTISMGMEFVAAFPSEERSSVSLAERMGVQISYRPGTQSSNVVVHKLSTIPEREREEICECFCLLFEKATERNGGRGLDLLEEWIVRGIERIAAIPPQYRRLIINHVVSILGDDKDSMGNFAAQAMGKEECAVENWVPRTRDNPINEIIKIIDAITIIPEHERESVVSSVVSAIRRVRVYDTEYFPYNNPFEQLRKIIRAMADIPREKRAEAVAATKRFIDPVMTLGGRNARCCNDALEAIATTFRQSPAEHRYAVINGQLEEIRPTANTNPTPQTALGLAIPNALRRAANGLLSLLDDPS